MIDVTFARGTGNVAAAINYCMADSVREVDADNKPMRDADGNLLMVHRDPKPVLVSGDNELLQQVCDSLSFKHKYTSGALSWEAGETITPEQEQQIIQEWQDHFLPELEQDRYAISWIRHTHAGHHELHYVMAKVDLETGKSLNAKPPTRDYDYTNKWVTAMNLKYGWSDPFEIERSLDFQLGSKEEIKAGLDCVNKEKMGLFIMQRIAAGVINNQDDVVASIEECGLTIAERKNGKPIMGKDYISIVNPDDPEKNIRFKGAIYGTAGIEAAHDKLIEFSRNPDAFRQERDRTKDAGELAKLEPKLAELRRGRVEFFAKRYQEKPQRNAERNQEEEQRNVSVYAEAKQGFSAAEQRLDERVESSSRDASQADFRDGRSNEDVSSNALESDSAASGGLWAYMSNKLGASNLFRQAPSGGGVPNNTAATASTRREVLEDWQQKTKRKMSGAEALAEGLYELIRRTVEGLMRIFGFHASQADEAVAGASAGLGRTSARLADTSAAIEQANVRNDSDFKAGIAAMRENRVDELERFKTDINLVEYAASCGYTIDKTKSSKASVVMVGNGSKIIITTSEKDRHGIFFDVNDTKINGSIVDFVQHTTGQNLGQVRKTLRAFGGFGEPKEYIKPLPIPASFAAVQHAFARTQNIANHKYLSNRGISDATQADSRFRGMIRRDPRGNVVFPHYTRQAILTGYELKNQGFTGFSKGGRKAMWFSNNITKASKVYVVESGIDALSLAQFIPDPKAAYISVGGAMSPKQKEELKLWLKGKDVVVATDNDIAGKKLAADIVRTTHAEARSMKVEQPYFNDWNDDLNKLPPREQEQGFEMR